MTTQTMNTFETLDLETLANVEGGGWLSVMPAQLALL